MSIHPIETSQRIRQAYIRYLKTIKPFKDERLRREFAEALEEKNMLVKGPYLEFTPPFTPGRTLQALVDEGVLSPRFKDFFHDQGLRPDNPLYWHQEEAIRKAQEKRNLVINTGTGSGKTEAFLIPILDALLREAEAGTLSRPGVRALLLYPMNALANDQMKRLRKYLAKVPEITFGRYVGETEQRYKQAAELFQKVHNCPAPPYDGNELISREQMQLRPPHILLTNYAMLEYLLLRPEDTALFDGESGKYWRFIVLDEAHTYDGAQATEIAMLLRRLQDRVTQGGQKKLQAIASSATLGDDTPENRAQIARFAEKLFNLPFQPEDVIFSKREPESGLVEAWGRGSTELYAELESLASSWRSGKDPALPDTLPGVSQTLLQSARQAALKAEDEERVPRFLYEILKGDEALHRLRNSLQKGPLLFHEAARQVFSTLTEDQALKALADLVSIAILARERSDKLALLPARYHLFARALEGAFVCLNQEHPAHQPILFLNRQKFCQYCGSRVFELANCTRCGESYLIGDERSGNELPESEFCPSLPSEAHKQYLVQNSIIYDDELEARRLSYFVLESMETISANEDALVEAESDVRTDEEVQDVQLCPRCGAILSGESRCKCGVPLLRVSRVEMGKKRTLERCVSCSTYTKGGVIFRFLTSQYAPVSVLASTLYGDVPSAKEGTRDHDRPGNGRKLLIFTDNRQRAAFFAPYLQRAQNRQLRRRLMVESLKNLQGDEPLRFSDWMDLLLSCANRLGVFAENDYSLRQKRLTVATWLMQEFSGLDKRISLEGVGLLYFRPLRLPSWMPPQALLSPPWSLSPEESFLVLAILLNTLRRQGAVTFLLENEGIHLLDSEKKNEFLPRARLFYVRETQAENFSKFGVYSWLPSEGYSNSRQDYLIRLLARKKGETKPSKETILQATQMLSALWGYLIAMPKERNWFVSDSKERAGMLYRLNHHLWEVIPTLEDDLTSWYVCDTCQNLTVFSVDGICPTYGCRGTLRALAEQPYSIHDNLYRYQYQHEEPLVLTAAEHTAQWKPQKAAEIQQKFIDGEINVLSSSTTFELGVDVGDLNTVLLHNVPPSTANYVQRAGRAGRRTNSVAIVVTFAQRRQHDLNFYADPERLIAGKIRPPVVPLRNDKIIRRHLHSVAFAAFLRWAKEKYGYVYHTTGDFFAPEDPARNGVKLFKTYLASRPSDVQTALLRITPNEDPTLAERLRLEQWEWLSYLIDSENAVLDRAAETLIGELSEFRHIEEKAASERKYDDAEQARRVQETIRSRELLGYLGTKNVLPKYGFPADVVPLQTDHLNIESANYIELERDLREAISEFAPGGQVVSAGKIWYSRGLKRLPGRSWVSYRYAICNSCNRINILPGEQMIQQCICGHPIQGSKNQGVYVVPEYGFIADNKTDTPGENPPERIYASRIYLANYQTAEDTSPFDPQNFILDESFTAGIHVWKGYTRNAYLGLVNKGYGQGFRICTVCGYADVIEPGAKKGSTEHRNPLTHQKCTGTQRNYHLGHHFMTDVLQLRFSQPPLEQSAIYSLLYAILNGASDALEIPPNDIGGLIFYPDGAPSFLLYDTTPGGSGHVEMVFNNLRTTFESAYKRVANCDGCSSDTSCYSCLRNYNNQRVHDILVRGQAATSLAKILGIEHR